MQACAGDKGEQDRPADLTLASTLQGGSERAWVAAVLGDVVLEQVLEKGVIQKPSTIASRTL
jgi:hypothetical protein